MKSSQVNVAAIIAAAGLGQRMGQPKQLLPWGRQPLIKAVVENVVTANAMPLYCVVGHRHDDVRAVLQGTCAQLVYNPRYRSNDLLRSYQIGIRALIEWERQKENSPVGTLLVLGDQPHVPASVIEQIISKAQKIPGKIIFPSYRHRRGHPFYVPRHHWDELLALQRGQTMKALISRHEKDTVHINVDTEAILLDLDTPEDYQKLLSAYGDSGASSRV